MELGFFGGQLVNGLYLCRAFLILGTIQRAFTVQVIQRTYRTFSVTFIMSEEPSEAIKGFVNFNLRLAPAPRSQPSKDKQYKQWIYRWKKDMMHCLLSWMSDSGQRSTPNSCDYPYVVNCRGKTEATRGKENIVPGKWKMIHSPVKKTRRHDMKEGAALQDATNVQCGFSTGEFQRSYREFNSSPTSFHENCWNLQL